MVMYVVTLSGESKRSVIIRVSQRQELEVICSLSKIFVQLSRVGSREGGPLHQFT